MGTIDFTVEFDVQNGSATGYRNFITNLRTRLRDGQNQSHGRPILRPQQNPPQHWFELVLRTSATNAVRFRIRSDNLYVIGYRAEGGQQWFEFDNDSQAGVHLIAGSTFLGFDGQYGTLQNRSEHRRDIDLGHQQLASAVDVLYRGGGPNDRARARALIIVIQMISESTRFLTISDFLFANWNQGARPTPQVLALENGWGPLSEALIQQDNDAHSRFRLHDNDMQITSAAEAVLRIAILLFALPQSGPRIARMAEIDGSLAQAAPQYPVGRRLVEVFWVRINNIDEEDPGQLYGTIKAIDGLSSQYLYNRDSSNPQDVKPGQDIELIGPPRPISAAGDFLIDLSLYDHDKLSPDDEIIKDQISWNAYGAFNEYNKVHNRGISGKYGRGLINYIVLNDASEALIQVVLISGDDESPANVYGTIKASNGFGDSQLFKRSSDNYVNVYPGKDIPLLRTSMAVPQTKDLVIQADLWDQDTLSPDDEIAKGSAKFKPLIAQSAKSTITGKHGKIEVRITWF